VPDLLAAGHRAVQQWRRLAAQVSSSVKVNQPPNHPPPLSHVHRTWTSSCDKHLSLHPVSSLSCLPLSSLYYPSRIPECHTRTGNRTLSHHTPTWPTTRPSARQHAPPRTRGQLRRNPLGRNGGTGRRRRRLCSRMSTAMNSRTTRTGLPAHPPHPRSSAPYTRRPQRHQRPFSDDGLRPSPLSSCASSPLRSCCSVSSCPKSWKNMPCRRRNSS
jgi:hypothetical protein